MKRAALLSLLVLASAAGAAVQEIRWSEAGVHAQALELAPGKFAEVCGPLKAGEQVAWSFEADGLLNFNIHFHEGEKVTYPSRENGVTKREGLLKVEQGQGYCWMWSNKGEKPVRLKLQLQQKR